MNPCLSVHPSVFVSRYNELQLKKLLIDFQDLFIFEFSSMWRINYKKKNFKFRIFEKNIGEKPKFIK